MTTHVAAALMAAGNAVTKSAKRTPKGESWDDFIGETWQRGSLVPYLETKSGPVAAIDRHGRDVSLAHSSERG